MLRDKVSVELTDKHDKIDSIPERDTNILEHFFFNSKTAEFTGNIFDESAFQFFKFVVIFTKELFKVIPES